MMYADITVTRTRISAPSDSELENSGIRVAVGDCSVTERRRWRPPYQTGKTVQVHAKHYNHNEDGRTAPGVTVRQWFRTAEPHGERRYENWNHGHLHDKIEVRKYPPMYHGIENRSQASIAALYLSFCHFSFSPYSEY